MPRPRFRSLPPAQQQIILDAALAEFAAHGYAEASLNRIIRAAGISKGSMYYYFDDKRDLYEEVIGTALSRIAQDAPGAGGQDVGSATDPDAFWLAVEDHAVHLAARVAADPDLLALLRGALDEAEVMRTKEGVEHLMMPWLRQTLAAGQAVGAIRTDLPAELLIAVAIGMGRAIDAWLLTRASSEGEPAGSVPPMIGLIRGTLSP